MHVHFALLDRAARLGTWLAVGVFLFACGTSAKLGSGERTGAGADAGSPEPGTTTPEVDGGPLPSDASAEPPSIQTFLEALNAYRDGGDSDFNGDGIIDVTTTFAGNSERHVLHGKTRDLLTVERPDDTHVHASGDLDEDGVIDYTLNGDRLDELTYREIATWDTDFDKIEDRRITRVFTTADPPSTTFTLEELRAQADGGAPAFTPVTTWTRTRAQMSQATCGPPGNVTQPASSEVPQNCDPMSPFPKVFGFTEATVLTGYHVNVRVDPTGQNGACNEEEGKAIRDAMEFVITRNLVPLMRVNPTVANAVLDALANRDIGIACGNHCVAAATWPPGLPMIGDRKWYKAPEWSVQININVANVSLEPAHLREFLMHELLHASGIQHEHGEDGDGQTDLVYSCARYSNKCTQFSKRSGSTTHGGGDCARCADTAHKPTCGSTFGFWGAACPSSQAAGWDAVCKLPGSPGAPCNCCLMMGYELNCDGTVNPKASNPAQSVKSCFNCAGVGPARGQEDILAYTLARSQNAMLNYDGVSVDGCAKNPPLCP